MHREIDVECLPADILEKIEIDVSELLVNQAVRVRDLAVDPKWKPVTDGDVMLVHVAMPKAEEPEPTAVDAAAAATATPAEPEVIMKGRSGPKRKRVGPASGRACRVKLVAGLGNPGSSYKGRATMSASRSSTAGAASRPDVRSVARRRHRGQMARRNTLVVGRSRS